MQPSQTPVAWTCIMAAGPRRKSLAMRGVCLPFGFSSCMHVIPPPPQTHTRWCLMCPRPQNTTKESTGGEFDTINGFCGCELVLKAGQMGPWRPSGLNPRDPSVFGRLISQPPSICVSSSRFRVRNACWLVPYTKPYWRRVEWRTARRGSFLNRAVGACDACGPIRRT